MAYKKLSPAELRRRGLSSKSERYIDSRTGEIISKRQYQQKKLAAKHGKRISLEKRAANFFKGLWKYLTSAIRNAATKRRRQARARVEARARRARQAYKAQLDEAAARWKDMGKRAGEWTGEDWVAYDEDIEDWGKETVVEAIYPEDRK